MRCPSCGQEDDKVIDSRSVRDGRAVRRRRECLGCGERFTTYEAFETKPVLVFKRDGRRVAYDRDKVLAGIAKACEKRPVALEEIENIVEAIELKLAGIPTPEASTQTIGKLILQSLREVDEVAYIRFASVYHSFQNVDEFLDELRGLQIDKEKQP
ncbi:MAG: transcriptional regulator NrdR [bacterium]